jgi:hypothetical protein
MKNLFTTRTAAGLFFATVLSAANAATLEICATWPEKVTNPYATYQENQLLDLTYFDNVTAIVSVGNKRENIVLPKPEECTTIVKPEGNSELTVLASKSNSTLGVNVASVPYQCSKVTIQWRVYRDKYSNNSQPEEVLKQHTSQLECGLNSY